MFNACLFGFFMVAFAAFFYGAMKMPIKSQGTRLYFVDKLTTPATTTLVKMSCPSSLSGVGSGAKDRVGMEVNFIDV